MFHSFISNYTIYNWSLLVIYIWLHCLYWLEHIYVTAVLWIWYISRDGNYTLALYFSFEQVRHYRLFQWKLPWYKLAATVLARLSLRQGRWTGSKYPKVSKRYTYVIEEKKRKKCFLSFGITKILKSIHYIYNWRCAATYIMRIVSQVLNCITGALLCALQFECWCLQTWIQWDLFSCVI